MKKKISRIILSIIAISVVCSVPLVTGHAAMTDKTEVETTEVITTENTTEVTMELAAEETTEVEETSTEVATTQKEVTTKEVTSKKYEEETNIIFGTYVTCSKK